MKKNILLIFMLIALATTSLWAQTTISFDGVTANDKDNGCNYTWPESNAYLTIQSPNVAGGCSYSIADGAVGLMYANLKVNLIPIGSEFESISVDIDAGCGEGCAKLTAYYQGQWVDETSNFETGASTLELWLWGTPVDLVVIEGVETTVDEIRLVPLQADVCNPFFTWYKNEDGSISFDFAGAAKLTEEYSWVFDFEEGYSAFDEANPTYSFKGQGDHNVCLTINKNGEQCAQFCDIIPEKDNCAADFQSYNNDLNPMKIDVQLSEWAIIPPNATLIWDMGDGTIYQDATKLDHVYSSEGNFTITLRIVLNETELCSSTNWVSVYEPQIKRIYTYKMKDGKYAFLLLDNKGYYEIGTEQVPDDWNREIVSAGKYTVNDANATYSFSEDWGNCSSSAIYDFLADGVQNSITFTQNADTCSIRKEILTGGVFRELSTCEAQLWYDNDLKDVNTYHFAILKQESIPQNANWQVTFNNGAVFDNKSIFSYTFDYQEYHQATLTVYVNGIPQCYNSVSFMVGNNVESQTMMSEISTDLIAFLDLDGYGNYVLGTATDYEGNGLNIVSYGLIVDDEEFTRATFVDLSADLCQSDGMYSYNDTTIEDVVSFTLLTDNCSNRSNLLDGKSYTYYAEPELWISQIAESTQYNYIEFNRYSEKGKFSIGIADTNLDYDQLISSGTYSITFDQIVFYGNAETQCKSNGVYQMVESWDGELVFILISDDCTERANALTYGTFRRNYDDTYMDCNAKIETSADGLYVGFKIQAPVPILSQYFYFGDFNYSEAADPTHQYEKAGIYETITWVVGANGCYQEIKQTVAVGDLTNVLYADFIIQPSLTDPNTFKFINKSYGQNFNSNWYFGDGKFSSNYDEEHTYKEQGYYEVCLTISNDAGEMSVKCQDVVSGTSDSTSNCAVSIVYEPTDTTNTSFNFKAVGNNVDTYTWAMSNGTTANAKTVLSALVPGYNWVYLSAYNSVNGCFTDAYEEIYLEGEGAETMCDAKIITEVVDRENRIYKFTAKASNADTYYFSLTDYSYYETPTITHKFEESGIYGIYLSAYNSENYCYAEDYVELVVTASDDEVLLNADFGYNIQENTVLFNSKVTGNPTSYYWTFGDGAYDTIPNPKYVYTTMGYYEVCLYVENAATGAYDYACKDVQLMDMAISTAINCKAKFKTFVTGTKVKLLNQSMGDKLSYYWVVDDMISSTDKDMELEMANGLHYAGLTIYDPLTGCSDFYYETFQVGEVNCAAKFDYKVDPKNLKVTFTSKSPELIHWWFNDEGEYYEEVSPVMEFEYPGVHYVMLTVSDESMTCFDYKEIEIQVGEALCDARFSAYVNMNGAANEATFEPERKNFTETTLFFWSFGDGYTAETRTAQHSYEYSAYYTVSLSTYDPVTGCMDYSEQVLLIGESGHDCEARFVFQSDKSSNKVEFFNESTGTNLGYLWYFDDLTYESEINPSHTFEKAGYYNVCLYIWDQTTGMDNLACKSVPVGDVSNALLAQFVYTADPVNKKVMLSNTSLGNYDLVKWDFGDGSFDNSPKEVTHQYAETGYYLVYLYVENTQTKVSSESYQLVKVDTENIGFAADFVFKSDSSTEKSGGYPTDFVGSSFGKPSKSVWDFGDGTKDSTSVTPNHIYEKPGTYHVCFTVSDPVTNQQATECKDVVIQSGTGIKDIEVQTGTMETYPNPFNGSTKVYYNLASDCTVVLSLYDLSGKRITTLLEQKSTSGSHTYDLNGSSLAPGVYYLKLESGTSTITNKLVIVR